MRKVWLLPEILARPTMLGFKYQLWLRRRHY